MDPGRVRSSAIFSSDGGLTIVQHIAIRREEYVAGTRQRPEVGVFTQTHATRRPVPWGRISIGEKVWMKWCAGPIVAQAAVSGFRQIEECSAAKLRDTVRGFRLYDLEEYWRTRPPSFFGLTVYLESEAWLDKPLEPSARSRGESWIIVNSPQLEAAWLRSSATSKTALPTSRANRRRTRTLPPSLRFEVLRRDDFCCQYCGRRAPSVRLEVDHLRPWSSGGTHHLGNLKTACSDCNRGKGAKHLGHV